MALLTLLVMTMSALVSVIHGQESLQCEPIKLELCTQYNLTGMPNLMGHQLQGDAKAGLETFLPLIQFGCSPDLLFFLCSVHVPMCVSLPATSQGSPPANTLIGPCRPLCERVKSSCQHILHNFKLDWPAALACDRFPPSNNDQHMCMDGGDNIGHNTNQATPYLGDARTFQILHKYPELIKNYQEFSKEKPELAIYNPILRIYENSHNMKPAQGFSDKCSDVAYPALYHYVNRTQECVPLCDKDILHLKEDKQFAMIWLVVWAGLCLVSTLFSLLTFLLDMSVMQYPEKVIIWLNLTYLLMSLGFLLSVVMSMATGETVGCMTLTSAAPNHAPVSLLVKQGLSPTPQCTLVFILTYFSIISSTVWWAIITTTWAIMVFCSLTPNIIGDKSPILHSFGWGVPAALTVTCLVLHYIEGDELTGICLPGQQTEETLLHMLVIPCSVALASGFIFFLSGLVASLVIPGDNTKRMMARISMFFILYSIPQICVLASLVYEVIERKNWRKEVTRPNIEVFILRLFMWLIVGIISCGWVFSKRTLTTWSKLFINCCGLWTGGIKKPPTPEFPKVAYHHPSSRSHGSGSDTVTLGEFGAGGTLKRQGGVGGYHHEGAPLIPHHDPRRIIIGSQDTNRIII